MTNKEILQGWFTKNFRDAWRGTFPDIDERCDVLIRNADEVSPNIINGDATTFAALKSASFFLTREKK